MSADRILAQLLAGGTASGLAAGLAGGVAGGLLTGKRGRKLAGKALKMGGIAAVGGLAYAAWTRARQDEQLARAGAEAPGAGAAAPALERFVPPAEQPEAREALGLTLLRAMIAAAQADGRLDGDERRAIFDRVASLELRPDEKAELFAQLEKPVELGTLVAAASTPEIAAEIYASSLLAIDVDTAAERGYLTMLAARLGLPETLVAALHRELETPAAAEAADAVPKTPAA